jgi:hypothetical protein
MSRQHNLATKDQLLELGHTRGQVDGWIRRGHVEAFDRGVVRIAGCLQPREQRAHANVLRAGPGARADGATTLAILGVEGFRLGKHGGVLVPRSRTVSGVDYPVRRTDLASRDLAKVAGVPGLRVARAFIDAATLVGGKVLRIAIDDAWRKGLVRHESLQQRAGQLPRAPGARNVLAAYASGTFAQESEGERVMAAFLAPLELDLEWGVDDVVEGRRLDAFARTVVLIFEFDGRGHHVLPSDRDSDGLRDLECAAAKVDGVAPRVVRVTWGMMRERPQETLRWLRRLIDRRREELARLRSMA